MVKENDNKLEPRDKLQVMGVVVHPPNLSVLLTSKFPN